MPGAPSLRSDGPTSRTDAQVVAWWLALGAGAGGIAGLVIGGVGGRLLMLALRRQSPGVSGIVSDAGFEMGRFTISGSLQLAAVTTVLGVISGLGYLLLRPALPAFARVPAATLLGATVGGASNLDPDGIDLLLIDPPGLAVVGFIALPALAAMAIALLVERGARLAPPAAAPWMPTPRVLWAVRLVATVLVLAVIVTGAQAVIEDIDRIP